MRVPRRGDDVQRRVLGHEHGSDELRYMRHRVRRWRDLPRRRMRLRPGHEPVQRAMRRRAHEHEQLRWMWQGVPDVRLLRERDLQLVVSGVVLAK